MDAPGCWRVCELEFTAMEQHDHHQRYFFPSNSSREGPLTSVIRINEERVVRVGWIPGLIVRVVAAHDSYLVPRR